MTQYGLGQDYTLALDLLSGSTTSLMTPRQNMLCTTAAKVINGRLVLRLQQWTFHQRDWNLTLSSACKEECVASGSKWSSALLCLVHWELSPPRLGN